MAGKQKISLDGKLSSLIGKELGCSENIALMRLIRNDMKALTRDYQSKLKTIGTKRAFNGKTKK